MKLVTIQKKWNDLKERNEKEYYGVDDQQLEFARKYMTRLINIAINAEKLKKIDSIWLAESLDDLAQLLINLVEEKRT